jgi:hypothetical protein
MTGRSCRVSRPGHSSAPKLRRILAALPAPRGQARGAARMGSPHLTAAQRISRAPAAARGLWHAHRDAAPVHPAPGHDYCLNGRRWEDEIEDNYAPVRDMGQCAGGTKTATRARHRPLRKQRATVSSERGQAYCEKHARGAGHRTDEAQGMRRSTAWRDALLEFVRQKCYEDGDCWRWSGYLHSGGPRLKMRRWLRRLLGNVTPAGCCGNRSAVPLPAGAWC